MKMMIKGKDPFYRPGEYNEGASTFVARKSAVKDGKVKHRYVYGKASKKWDPIPEGKTSFEIGNHGTGATIHITCTPTTGNTKVIGTLRNKDGENLARISKEINTGEAFTDEYRKWKPNKQRLITMVVKELQLHDRPVSTMRDIERSMQDIGMFPEELANVKNMHIVKSIQDQQIGFEALATSGKILRSLGKSTPSIFEEIEGNLDKGFDNLMDSSEMLRLLTLDKSLPAIRMMREFLDFGRVSDRTRRQLVRRSKSVFGLLNPKDQKEAIPYMFDITRHDYP
jgi:hypothetical protein